MKELDKKGYYTDKIQDGYLTITSGLGKAGPRYLLIEPLIWNQMVFGIIEIALCQHSIFFGVNFPKKANISRGI